MSRIKRGEPVRGATLAQSRPPGVPRVLDPHGIYGTRSQTRRHQAQRRRLIHNSLLTLLAALALSAVWIWSRVPRVAWWQPAWSFSLSSTVCAPATAWQNGGKTQILIPLESGQIALGDLQSRRFTPIAVHQSVPATAQITGDIGFAGGQDGTFCAFDTKSRRRLWSYASGASISAQPTLFSLPSTPNASPAAATSVADAPLQIVVGGNDAGLVFALNARNGRPLWVVRLDGPVGNGLVASRDGDEVRVFVPVLAGTVSRGGLRVLDGRSGRDLWRYPSDSRIYAAQVAPPLPVNRNGATQANTSLFCVDEAGAVAVLEAHTGRRTARGWKIFIAPLPQHPPDSVVSLRLRPLLFADGSGENLIVAGNDGGVRALDANTGRVAWIFDAGAPIVSMVAASRDWLAVINDAGEGTLLDARSGRAVRRWQAPRANGGRYYLSVSGTQLLCLSGAQGQSFTLSNDLGR